MLEYPELHTISTQMRKRLVGKTVSSGALLKRNNNLFMGADESEKYALLSGGTISDIDFYAPEIYIRLDNGYGILFCQCGGKIIYHEANTKLTENQTIRFSFVDGSSISYTMKLWSLGIYAVKHEDWEARKRNYASRQFQSLADNTFMDYVAFIHQNEEQAKMPIKVFLSKYIAGVMSSFAAEILLYAKVYPTKQLKELTEDEHHQIYNSMRQVLQAACEKGGRITEVDLFDKKGGYIAKAERKKIGSSCPLCGNTMAKITSGGVTAFCPVCQTK